MVLRAGARVAVVGAGPGGLTAAKHALEAGFDTTVFEASDDLGGQWHTTTAHSGVWPGMHTNTSRAMTSFSDLPAPRDFPLHPAATQVQDHLRTYAERAGVLPCIRYGTRVERLEVGWRVDGEPFDAVVLASGRFRRPRVPAALRAFTGELLHAYDHPGGEHFRGRRTLVLGNGVSGLEIAADLARTTAVVSACRRPRWVLQKVADGVPSDWQWYTHAAALERLALPRDELAAVLRERVLRVAGDPADSGAPSPDPDVLVAGTSLGQDYLSLVASGRVVCRPDVARVEGRRVTYVDGTADEVDALVCATGYDVDLPYLPAEVARLLGPDLRLHLRTLHPDLPTLGVVGQFLLQGPYLPLLELQARLVVGTWSGAVPVPDEALMRASVAQPAPAVDLHHLLALQLADAAGVSPDLAARPDLAEPLLLGPMLPARYRLDGPGALPDAARTFRAELTTARRAAVTDAERRSLVRSGLGDLVVPAAGQPTPRSGADMSPVPGVPGASPYRR